jgi:hypothetical protein
MYDRILALNTAQILTNLDRGGAQSVSVAEGGVECLGVEANTTPFGLDFSLSYLL